MMLFDFLFFLKYCISVYIESSCKIGIVYNKRLQIFLNIYYFSIMGVHQRSDKRIQLARVQSTGNSIKFHFNKWNSNKWCSAVFLF